MSTAQPHGAAAVFPGMVPKAGLPGLDLAALTRYLNEARFGTAGPLRGHLLAGGRSNLTYLVTDDEHRWVLRRPPLGHILPTAHDMSREYRVLTSLAGSAVPVPRTVLHCGTPDVLGAPFYLMEHVEGIVYRTDAQLAAVSVSGAAKMADGLVDVLVALHSTCPAAVGLADIGRADGYLTRQLTRWRRQLAAGRTRAAAGSAELGDRLAASIPAQASPAVVHGDYRLDNVLVDATDPGRVRAVLDWEMATLGDPLTDVAAMLTFWDGMRGMDTVITATPADHPVFPDRTRLLDRYAEGTGSSLSALPWYLGFAYYKLAVICEGLHHRHLRGETVGEGFDRIGALAPHLVERAHRSLDG